MANETTDPAILMVIQAHDDLRVEVRDLRKTKAERRKAEEEAREKEAAANAKDDQAEGDACLRYAKTVLDIVNGVVKERDAEAAGKKEALEKVARLEVELEDTKSLLADKDKIANTDEDPSKIQEDDKMEGEKEAAATPTVQELRANGKTLPSGKPLVDASFEELREEGLASHKDFIAEMEAATKAAAKTYTIRSANIFNAARWHAVETEEKLEAALEENKALRQELAEVKAKLESLETTADSDGSDKSFEVL